MDLPQDVRIIDLKSHQDDRGIFTELFRQTWIPQFEQNQINYVRSAPNVLRGVHVHRYHSDFLVFVEGTVLLGLKDLRKNSPTFLQGGIFEFSSEILKGIFVPPGVAHGFYFPQGGAHVYTVDRYFDGSDEFGCMYNDPELGLPWPTTAPHLSPRDQKQGTLKSLLELIEKW